MPEFVALSATGISETRNRTDPNSTIKMEYVNISPDEDATIVDDVPVSDNKNRKTAREMKLISSTGVALKGDKIREFMDEMKEIADDNELCSIPLEDKGAIGKVLAQPQSATKNRFSVVSTRHALGRLRKRNNPDGVKVEPHSKTGQSSIKADPNEAAEISETALSLNEASKKPFVLPRCCDWFDGDAIHDIERRSLPEFFQRRSYAKSPSIYKQYRNVMINLYRRRPDQYLTATESRRYLAGDVCAILRVHQFLERWGLINFCVRPASKPYRSDAAPKTALNSESSSSSKTSATKIKKEQIKREEMMKEQSKEDKKLLPYARRNLHFYDDLFETPEKGTDAYTSVNCHHCNEEITFYYHCMDPERENLDLCGKCYANGHFPDGCDALTFERRGALVDTVKWTVEMTCRLLKELQLFKDQTNPININWHEIAKNMSQNSNCRVSASDCLRRFAQLPILEPYLEKVGKLDGAEEDDEWGADNYDQLGKAVADFEHFAEEYRSHNSKMKKESRKEQQQQKSQQQPQSQQSDMAMRMMRVDSSDSFSHNLGSSSSVTDADFVKQEPGMIDVKTEPANSGEDMMIDVGSGGNDFVISVEESPEEVLDDILATNPAKGAVRGVGIKRKHEETEVRKFLPTDIQPNPITAVLNYMSTHVEENVAAHGAKAVIGEVIGSHLEQYHGDLASGKIANVPSNAFNPNGPQNPNAVDDVEKLMGDTPIPLRGNEKMMILSRIALSAGTSHAKLLADREQYRMNCLSTRILQKNLEKVKKRIIEQKSIVSKFEEHRKNLENKLAEVNQAIASPSSNQRTQQQQQQQQQRQAPTPQQQQQAALQQQHLLQQRQLMQQHRMMLNQQQQQRQQQQNQM
eukprot:TRINITY_DN57_c0_g2_i2.p1 TRINITY_DN57_c0_g2~~TRINITY_DN57_c0_g2_i2.p1  ORF type:complete len:863 (-),score=352.16 TRINITY_DN57_c0_g2_i2:159-2747(-)